MAVSYGFYSALYINNGYDSIYQSGEISKLFNGLIIDGVYLSSRPNDPTNKQFMVSADTNDMHIKVAPGKAWFLGTYTVSDSDIQLTIDSADSSYDRIDAVVIEVNSKFTGFDPGPVFTERFNSIKVVTGTSASTPAKPTMIHEDGIDQYPIAYITVSKGTTAIRPYNIEYVVGIDTPYFAWICERLSIAELYSKWKSILGVQTMPFVTWFDSIQRMLGHGEEDYDDILNEIDLINSNDYIKGLLPRVDEQEYKTNGDGTTKTFTISVSSGTVIKSIADILVDGEMVYNYTVDLSTNSVTLKDAPAVGTNNVVIHYVVDADEYIIYFEEVQNA